jgi:hypothetical protein
MGWRLQQIVSRNLSGPSAPDRDAGARLLPKVSERPCRSLPIAARVVAMAAGTPGRFTTIPSKAADTSCLIAG